MIHHISIAVKNPNHVAQVLAEILKAQAVAFPPNPGSYIVIPFDQHGTAIELYPLGSQIEPGEGDEQCVFVHTPISSRFTDIHAAISVPITQEEIEQIGVREGWRVVRCNRDSFFDVIEFWVENRLMIEFLTPEMASVYLKFATQKENLKYFLPESALATVG
ncbi:hypothetical protein VF14_35130 [Nostoc linckia z18]|jgi:hypothetical protein|uniref:Uncharacterized protein n=3 Tax=Nostoc TaxID=1177 RepID=A0A9Q6EHR2_NOSLI|nr:MULTISPECIES: hypothetical protein [Nostoc]MBL1203662.1 hypothetical protein [Nostoc sp. GBBB01]MDZ8015100.1 hypothetical protein [Nostoc sp. ZfuVER08]PHK33209.1 hypothetical protein VF12_25675 [Nostoc linckia z15]PHK39232.1 hypothetical protein VF13_34825 [Nostoc linckia z16]MBC1239605.1 hypothetical protein [Nostoc sp. 2RC]